MPGFWRKCRITFRVFRLTVWALLLLALCAFAWFDFVGLPNFLKTRLVAALQERGVALEFSLMRLRPIHGLVCDNVRIGGAAAGGPTLAAREVQIRLNFLALLRCRTEISGLGLRDGQFTLPYAVDGALAFTNLQTQLRFESDDTWSLDHFFATMRGVKFSLVGTLAHAPAARNWSLFAGKATGNAPSAKMLQEFAEVLDQIRFTEAPQLQATLGGDARDLHSLTLRFNATVPNVRTPWLTAKSLQLAATVTAPAEAPTNCAASWDFWTNAQPWQLIWTLHAAEFTAARSKAEAVEIIGHWRAPELALDQFSARFGHGLFAATARLNVATRDVAFTGDSSFDLHALAPVLPPAVQEKLAKISWSHAPVWHVGGSLTLPAWTNHDWNWRADLAPTVQFAGALAFTNALVANFPVDAVRAQVTCTNQVWQLPQLELVQGKTRLTLSGKGDAQGQTFFARVAGELDATTVKPLLPAADTAQLNFSSPLQLELTAAGNWSQLAKTVVTGHARLKNFSAHGAQLESAQMEFIYSNGVWRLPDLGVTQGRTTLHLSGDGNVTNQNFSVRLRGAFDADSLKPFLTAANATRGFSWLTFHEPLALDVAAVGNFLDLNRLAAAGQLALTNFAIRGQTVEWLTSTVVFTNLTADFLHLQLARAGGTQRFSAEKITLDGAGQRLFFTRGEGNIEPMVVGRAIGPKTAKAMQPYQFLAIPQSRVNGCVPLRHANGDVVNDDADLYVDIVGTTPFRWRKFETPAITGTIHWLADALILTNATSECYGGEIHGHASFDLKTPGDGTDFNFFITGTNVDFHRMGMALWSPTNGLEGAVSGTVTVTYANSDDWRSWNGFGALALHDGMLWDVPVFGLVSPVLNKVSPGFGNSRAKEAAGDFVMTNGVIRTRSLTIRTPMMRLNYDGTVNLDEKVNARVTAHPLRNTPIVGSVLGWLMLPVSKAFECDVTGTLGDPKVTPVYVPEFLLLPLHPVRSVEKLFQPNPPAPAPDK